MNWIYNIDWPAIEAWARNQLATNEFLSGGIVVVILTATLQYARGIPVKVWGRMKELTHTTLEIHNDQMEAYHHMLKWLGQNPTIMKRNRSLQCVDYSNHCRFGFGSSWFFFKGRLIRINRYRKDETDTGTLAAREGITLKSWGRNQGLLQSLMVEANEMANKQAIRKDVDVYTVRDHGWDYMGCMLKRPLDSVVLPQGQMDAMINRIQTFKDQRDKYLELGIPHRLGVLLEGPPGSGKSSTIMALASHFDAQLKTINLSSLTDNDLISACGELTTSAQFRFIIFEDIDCVLRGDDTRKAIEKVTFSGLLNAIDGLASGQNRVVFMTTNHVEKLDPALIRPGRVNLRVHLGQLDEYQARRMYSRFLDGDPSEFAEQFTGQSAASAQEELIQLYFGDDK